MSKKFLIKWSEEVEFQCSVEIEAECEEDAIEKWRTGEFDDYVRDEWSNSFSDIEEIKEVKE